MAEQKTNTQTKQKQYPAVYPSYQDWPLYKLSLKRFEFLQDVKSESIGRITEITGDSEALLEELVKAVYLERIRLTQTPWKVDTEDEKIFWSDMRKKLVKLTIRAEKEVVPKEKIEEQLAAIIGRYTSEIAGHFDPNIFEFAKRLVPFGFSRLLNTSVGLKFKKRYNIYDKVHLTGETEKIRALARKGTVIMVPTHFSNLDSVMIGWGIQVLGLPAFTYGAGLNLFGIRLFSYFMNRLGAYKVDRRKKNMLYLETLKMYSNLIIQENCHSLFFPGGTRSRSGAIEKSLKKGLIGTAIEAQYKNIQKSGNGHYEKIFVVPVVINYHFVLEANVLIDEHLKRTGQEHYLVENDEYSTSYKMFKFVTNFLTKSSEVTLSFAPPMDLFGNKVDENGQSFDTRGKEIDIRDYYTLNNQLNFNRQRNEEYTRLLSEKIVDCYHRYNTLFSSHLIAFTAFAMLKKRFRRLDVYGMLRLPEEDRIIEWDDFLHTVNKLRKELLQMRVRGKIQLAPIFELSTEEIISHGLENLGIYHDKSPLYKNKHGQISSEDMNLLYYYHNRTLGYKLEKFI